MSENQKEAIRMIQQICYDHRWDYPSIPMILNWFEQLPRSQQRRLGKINWSKRDVGDVAQRCHVFGVAIVKQFLIWAVKQCNWIPQQRVVKRLVKQVINYEGNFVICQKKYNTKWWEERQSTLRDIVRQGDKDDINISKRKVLKLFKLLNTIKKRYLKQFYKRCIKKGVPEDIVYEISLYFEQICKKAQQVRDSTIIVEQSARTNKNPLN